MKKFLLFSMLSIIFCPQVFALKTCSYDYDGNKTCKHITPEEIRTAKSFRRVEMFDDNGRRVRLYLKSHRHITQVINTHKAHIGYGFEDAKGNVHIVDRGRIVKSFYATR